MGCSGEDDTSVATQSPADTLKVNTQFAATYLQTIEKQTPTQNVAAAAGFNVTKSLVSATRYNGQLEVTNVATNEKQVFDWPVTQKVDEQGEVETISHRALTLKQGTYDFRLLLATEGGKQRQYMAQALGEEILDGAQPEIDFVLLPNLGEIISDFSQVQYASTLKFAWPAAELAGLTDPQFGLSLNGGDETVYDINKETGLAEAFINVQPGQYQLDLHLYDGNLMVGKNEDTANTINFAEGEDAQLDVIPLQADVSLNLSPLKDVGTFTFSVPREVVAEVDSAQNLAMIVRLSGEQTPLQEVVLTVDDVNGHYQSSVELEIGGAERVDAYVAFHHIDEASQNYSQTPFASCNTQIDVALNQTLGCQLALEHESIISGRILGTLMLNVIDQHQQPAIGVPVYVDGKKIGLTGDQYSAGSIKANLVAGEHDIKVEDGMLAAADKIEMKPLVVENKVLYLQKRAGLGDGAFVKNQNLNLGSGDDDWSDASTFADIDNDGDLDLLLSRRRNLEVIYLNNGQGKFNLSPTAFGDKVYTQSLATADFNGDGYQDVVRLTTSGDEIYLNDGLGNLMNTGQSLGSGESEMAAIGDINSDGYLDIVVAQQRKSPLVYLNDGKGYFADSGNNIADISGSYYPGIELIDVNSDSHLDVIWAGGDGLNMILLNDGKGHFADSGQRLGQSRSEDHFKVAAGDLNGDGKPDLVITNIDYNDYEQNQVFINDGTGFFALAPTDIGVNGVGAAMADVDSDGDLDLLVTGASKEQAKLYINDGLGGLSVSSLTSFIGNNHIPLFGDVDGDGDLDLVVTYGTGSQVYLNQPAP